MDRRRQELLALGILIAGGAIVFCLGINWGLPSRRVDKYLFGDRPAWSGKEIQTLAGTRPVDPSRGSDMDADDGGRRDGPVAVNETDAQRAEIVRRYRLYTYHPDEMVTMMALAGMRPGEGDFDPKMYQYGGLWIYPVGALLRLAGACRLITLTSDLTYYLDHPEAFGRFYIVARACAAAWALVGIWAVFRIVCRLTRGSLGASTTAAACFAVMPAVITAAHEAKPHLPGVVLTLLAVLAAMRCLDQDERKWWILSCLLAGAAAGMVMAAWPVLAVLVVLALLARQPKVARFAKAEVGIVIALLTCLATNPYVVVNLFRNRELIRNNLANTRSMFHIGPMAEAVPNALRLIGEGTSVVLALAGLAGIIALAVRDRRMIKTRPPVGPRFVAHWLLAAPAFLVLVQFVIFAHGQGGEYARFALLVDVTLCIAAVVALDTFTRHWKLRRICQAVLLVATAVPGGAYAWAFVRDCLPDTTRMRQARMLDELRLKGLQTLAVNREPAPYCLPPVNLFQWHIRLLPRVKGGEEFLGDADAFVRMVDRPQRPTHLPPGYTWTPLQHSAPLGHTEMSWADKPFVSVVRTNPVPFTMEAPGDAP